MTKDKLIEQLNKLTAEYSELKARCTYSEQERSSLHNQLIWHKQLNQQLMEAILAGAKEGTWPRRQQL